MKTNNKTIVVTGGGSGIGRELVLQLLNKNARIITVDLNQENLDETRKLAGNKSENLVTHILDICEKASVIDFSKKVIEENGPIDGIINNAGIIQPFVNINSLDYSHIEHIMNVNFYGTLYMIKSFLPHLLKRPEAHITNISSMGGFIPFPGQTLYSASKAAVKILTEGLYGELKNSSVGVTVVMPGAIDTNISKNSGVDIPGGGDNENTSKMKALPASKAAEIIINGIEKNKYRVLVGSDSKFLDLYYRWSPKGAVNFIVKKMGM